MLPTSTLYDLPIASPSQLPLTSGFMNRSVVAPLLYSPLRVQMACDRNLLKSVHVTVCTLVSN